MIIYGIIHSFHFLSQMPEQNDMNSIISKELGNFMKRAIYLEIRKNDKSFS